MVSKCHSCPFFKACEKADHTESVLRIAEHGLCLCALLYSKTASRFADGVAQLRNVNNLLLAVKFWKDFTGDGEKVKETAGSLANILVPLAVLGYWEFPPLARHAVLLGRAGGCCLFVEGLAELYAETQRKPKTWGEALHNVLETPAEDVLPPLARATIGIGTGVCWMMYAAEE
jgi:hypothetical protein